MDPTLQLALATAAFLLTHFVSGTPLRPALLRRIGERPYLGLYSFAAFATLIWMIVAFRQAPREALWEGLRLAPALLMPFAFILLVGGALGRNPTAVMQQGAMKSPDPARGFIRITRHPMMWAIMLWSLAHLLARGDSAALLFFGGLFLLGALGTISQDRRKAQTLGADWARFAAVTSHVPFAAILQGRNRLAWHEIGWTRPLAGLVLYALFLYLHPWLFGTRAY